MRIHDQDLTGSAATGRASGVEQTQSQTKATSGYSRSSGDSVELSGASLALRTFNSARSARLEQLTKAVQSGSYSVDPALVSKALVNETVANGRA